MTMKLYIGNKNYSSWSMRPWVLLRHFGLPFDEVMLRFDSFEGSSKFKQAVARISPAGRVPVLVDGDLVVWDTLAIAETLAERFADLPLWPREPHARSRARSVCAEMHSGFGALRNHCPQNIEASLPEVGVRVLAEQPAVRADLVHDLGQRHHLGSGAFDDPSGQLGSLQRAQHSRRHVAHPYRLEACAGAGQRQHRHQTQQAGEKIGEAVLGAEDHRRSQQRDRQAAVAPHRFAGRLAAQVERRRVGPHRQRADVQHTPHAGRPAGLRQVARQRHVHALERRRIAVQDGHQVKQRIGTGQQRGHLLRVVHITGDHFDVCLSYTSPSPRD